jgi:hypothetical protein
LWPTSVLATSMTIPFVRFTYHASLSSSEFPPFRRSGVSGERRQLTIVTKLNHRNGKTEQKLTKATKENPLIRSTPTSFRFVQKTCVHLRSSVVDSPCAPGIIHRRFAMARQGGQQSVQPVNASRAHSAPVPRPAPRFETNRAPCSPGPRVVSMRGRRSARSASPDIARGEVPRHCPHAIPITNPTIHQSINPTPPAPRPGPAIPPGQGNQT